MHKVGRFATETSSYQRHTQMGQDEWSWIELTWRRRVQQDIGHWECVRKDSIECFPRIRNPIDACVGQAFNLQLVPTCWFGLAVEDDKHFIYVYTYFFLLRSVWWYSKAIPCDMFHWGRLVLCSGANLVSPKLDDWTLNNKASPISSCTRFNCCWTLLFNPFHLASVRTPSMQLYSELRRSSQVDQAASAGIRPSWSKLSIFKESMNSVAT